MPVVLALGQHTDRPQMRKFFASLGLVGCGLSALIHGATFFGVDPMMSWPALWVLHVAAMLLVLCAFFSGNVGKSRAWSGDDPWKKLFAAWDTVEINDAFEQLKQDNPNAEASIVRRFRSRPAAVVFYCLGAYALINFTIGLSLLDGGVPEQDGNSYRLETHGKPIRQLSEAEYRQARAVQTRLATGHWMAFFYASSVLWMAPRSVTREGMGG
jgi:hypothetical protein